jgi:hypothetical protein
MYSWTAEMDGLPRFDGQVTVDPNVTVMDNLSTVVAIVHGIVVFLESY